MAMSEAATTLLEAARAFRPRILAERERIEGDRRLPDALARDLADAGFFRLFLPAAYGGLDLSPVEAMEVYEELARADASVAWCVWNCNINWTTAQLAPEVAQEVFADPNTILANSTRPTGRAEIVEGGYRVAGRWSLVSGCQISTWFILTCIIHEDGQPRRTPSGTPDYRFVFCPAAECSIVDTWTVSGLRGTGSHDVVVEDRFVPARLGSYQTDPIMLTAPQYQKYQVPRVSGLAAMALGIARNAIDTLVALATEKRQERTGQPLGEDRGAQARLAQAEALVRAARVYIFDTVNRLWDDALAGRATMTPQSRSEIGLAGLHAVTWAAQAVDLIYLTGGATSLYATCPIERAFRDIHAMTQHIAVHPRHLETIGRELFGMEPETPPKR